MSSAAQRAELQSKIWKIANDVRGSVDGWDFKQYVLGTLFYRFISENFSNYIEGGDESVKYAELDDSIITEEIKEDAIKTKGYFIYPSQLFANIAKNANSNDTLNTELKTIFDAIESSANGYPSELDIKGLFADFDTTSNRLGNTVRDKNSRLAAVIKGVEDLDFGRFEDNQIDLFGDAYEYLISNYAANAGKSGGEFFTPQCVSKLIAKLAIHKQTLINKIYDKTTPRLIQFHTLKNAANPPFLGGFSIFGTVAAEAEQRSCQGDSLFSMILCNDRKAIVTE